MPFEIPVSWKWVRVQDIFNVRSALRIHQTDWQSDGIPFFRGRELVQLANTGTTKPEIFISRELYEANKEKGGVPQKNDLLVSAVGTIGKVYIVQGTKEFYYKDAYILCFENYADIYVKYIKYALESPYLQEEIHRDSMATTVAQLTIIKAKSLMIPLPPLEEQKRIVAKIEELLPLVDEYDKAAGELETLNKILPDKLRKSVLQEAIHGTLVPNDIPEGEATGAELLQQILKERQEKENKEKGKKAKKLTLSTIEEELWELPEGWCWARLGDVFEMQAGKNISSSEIYETPSDDHPYKCYGGNGVRGYVKNYNTNGVHTIVGRQGALCGNVKYAEGPFYATEHAVVVSMDICDVMWSYYFLIACNLNQYATKTAQPGLSVAKILDTPFPLPPLSIQKAIVAKIEEIFASIDYLQDYQHYE